MNLITEKDLRRGFSRNLKNLRNLSKPPISQQQLANCLHIDRTLIAKYENGSLLPSVCTAVNMARYFKISVEALLMTPAGRRIQIEDFTFGYSKTH